MDIDVNKGDKLLINDCDDSSDTQMWVMEKFNSTKYREIQEVGPFEDDYDFTDMTINWFKK